MKTDTPLTDTWDHVKDISSIEAQLSRTLNNMKQCYVCGKKATHSVYHKEPNQFMGSFIGLCNNHTKKDL